MLRISPCWLAGCVVAVLVVGCGGGGGGGGGGAEGGGASVSDPGPEPIPDPVTGDIDVLRVVRVGERDHNYRLYVPGAAIDAGAVPLVLSLHGGGMTAADYDSFTGLRAKAAVEGFALLSPDGTSTSWNAGSCCAPSTTLRVDHVAVIDAMLDDAETLFAVDTDRVFAAGHSNGGMMVYRLACELSDRIAAIASNAAVMMNRNLDANPPVEVYACQPTRPVPVLQIHGLADRCAPFEGGISAGRAGGTRAPASDGIDFWAENNRCALVPLLPTYSVGTARCETHSLCQDGANVELCTIEGGGHVWPGNGGQPAVGDVCGGINNNDLIANDRIWNFFSRNPRR